MTTSNLLNMAALGAYSGYAIGNIGSEQLTEQNQGTQNAFLINRIAIALSRSPLLESSLKSAADFWGSFSGFILLLGASSFNDSSHIVKKLAEGASVFIAAHALAMLCLRKDASQAAFLIPCLASIAFKQKYLPKKLEKPYEFAARALQPVSCILSGNKMLMVLGLLQVMSLPELRK